MLEKSKFNSIFIEEPNVNNAFNLKSIFYSTKDYKLEEYAKNRWINTPSNMIYAQENVFERMEMENYYFGLMYEMKE